MNSDRQSDKQKDNNIVMMGVFQCHNPNLGLATKARCGKVASQEGDLRVTSHAPGSARSVGE
jgi:hypothetical protein